MQSRAHFPGTSRSLRSALVLLVVASLVLAFVEVVLMIASPNTPKFLLILYPATGLIYVAAGTLAWSRRPANRFGMLLIVGGIFWFVAGLVYTGSPVLIAAGEILATMVLALVIHLLLAFPSGRLRSRLDRGIVATAYFISLVLQAPLYLFGALPPPFDVLQIDDQPDLFDAGKWTQQALGVAVVLGAAAVMYARQRSAPGEQRRVLAPLTIYGVLAILFIPVAGALLPEFKTIDPVILEEAQVIGLAGLPVAFVVALVRGGFARTAGIEELGTWLGAEGGGRPPLVAALAETLGDPSVELVYWVPEVEGYVHETGAPAMLPAAGSGRGAVEVESGGRRIGAIVYDSQLIADASVVRAAGRVIAIELERERLTADLRASRDELRHSRRRIVDASDRERRRIAQDLHDGLQAQMVLLAIKGRDIGADPAASESIRSRSDDLGDGLETAIADLRGLIQGVMPAALIERGLPAAVEDLADRMPVPTALTIGELNGSLSREVESAGYFVVAEALTNAVKHGRAHELRVGLTQGGGMLRIEVCDDGIGGAGVGPGAGLRGMADRVDVLGGSLRVQSPAGGGTEVIAEVPCAS